MVWVSDLDASGTPPLRRVPGTSIWATAPGVGQDLVKGLHILAGLGASWGPSRGAGKYCW